jgi:predicted CXXCH cytochrome family protein
MKSLSLKAILVLGLGLAIVPVAVSRVKDTPHKLDGTNGVTVAHNEVCRPCHTPHNAIKGVEPIWNHTLSTATWTIDDDADLTSINSSSSRLCLSCHDGTVALDSYGGAKGNVFINNGVVGGKNLGTDLTTSHPIGVVYNKDNHGFNLPDANGAIVDKLTPAGQSAQLEDGKVQCGSCHYAHGSRAPYGMFLRVDNTGSQLCMTCHTGPG